MKSDRELTVAQWHRLNELLAQAFELEPQARAAWLTSLPADTAELRPVLTDLLSAPDPSQTTVDLTLSPVADLASAALSAMRDDAAGDRIGPWRLDRLLAEGGMGAVWIAQRADGVMQRTAALKLPRAEWIDRSLAERIARERAILARLQHPHIAVLYDAGLADGGRPYLALEYVDGVPIDAWCREHDELHRTLRLMVQVARAVAHAHGQLVIHRDLKPANVLVTGDGQPKLLDFGISKLIEGDATGSADATALTRLAGRPLTLAYAAPEQILGLPITVAADVYALGVMLFELTTGQRLYRASAPRELEAEVLRGDLRRPSDAASGSHRTRALRGDLDAIAAAALKRNPAERYLSAAAFADDLERFLDGKPVRARPDTRTYRLGKFLRRNTLAVAAGSAVIVALAAGLGIALWQADAAREQATRATALNTFVLNLIRAADPNASRQTNEADLAMLRSIEERIDHDFKGSPDQLLQLRTTVADAYKNRGEMVAAQRLMQRAVDEATPHVPPDDLMLLKARVNASDPSIIVTMAAARQLQQAIALLRPRAATSLETAELLVDALLWQSELGAFYGVPEQPTPEEVYANYAEATQLAIDRFGAGSLPHMRAVLAESLLVAGHRGKSKAGDMLEAVLAQANASGDSGAADSVERLRVQARHAAMMCATGRIDDGLISVRDALVRARAKHGDDSFVVESLSADFTECLLEAGDETFESVLQEAFDIAARREKPPSPNLLRRAMRSFSTAVGTRQLTNADRYYDAVTQNLAFITEPEMRDRLTLEVRALRVCQFQYRGEPAEALKMAGPIIAFSNQEYPKIKRIKPGEMAAWSCSSQAQRELGHYDEAIRTASILHDRCVDMRRILKAGSCEPRALTLIAMTELDAGHLDRARAALEKHPRLKQPDTSDWHLIVALARLRLAEGRGAETVDLLRENYGNWLSGSPHAPTAYEVLFWLGKALVASGDDRGHRFVAQARKQLAVSPLPSHRRLASGLTPGS